MPEMITARFRITTPMFIGDAHQQATHISPMAVKGALRFWWRALRWGAIREQSTNDEIALQQLHAEEATLFGAAAVAGRQLGQGLFKVNVVEQQFKRTEKDAVHRQLKHHAAARYLGYGLMEAFASEKKGTEAGQLVRECINEEQYFTVVLRARQSLPNSLLDAVIAFGLLGSLGSRARHGYGSVSLESMQRGSESIWQAPEDLATYQAMLRTLVNQAASDLPPFSAFSASSRIDNLNRGDNPYQVLEGFGRRLLLYRSWGRNGRVLGEPSEKRFKEDHDWSKGDRPKNFHPKRIIFGLPHNYGRGARLSVSGKKYDRRASPLIFHVHAFRNQFIGISTLLTSTFLPDNERINAGGSFVPVNADWQVITDFLDGNDKQGKPRFFAKESVV